MDSQYGSESAWIASVEGGSLQRWIKIDTILFAYSAACFQYLVSKMPAREAEQQSGVAKLRKILYLPNKHANKCTK